MGELKTYGSVIRESRGDLVFPTGWLNRELAEVRAQTASRRMGGTFPTTTATAAPGSLDGPPVFSTDDGTYGTASSQAIPAFCQIGKRLFRTEQRIVGQAAGTFIEDGLNAHARISFSDIDIAGDPFDPTNWSRGVYILSTEAHPHLQGGTFIRPMHDGRLYICCAILNRDDFPNMGAWATILQNPLDPPASWTFGDWSSVGNGHPNAPYFHGEQLRQGVSRLRASETFDPAIHRKVHQEVMVYENTVISREISVVPPVSGADNGTPELVTIPFGESSVWAIFRTNAGPRYCVSHKSGEEGSWSAPAALPWMTTSPISKMALARSPSGRLVFVYNDADNFTRTNMTIAIFDGEDITQTPTVNYTFDAGGSLTGDKVTYPDVGFRKYADGSYAGQIVVGYDQGRGSDDTSDGQPNNNIYLTLFDEQGLMDGDLTFTQYNYLP